MHPYSLVDSDLDHYVRAHNKSHYLISYFIVSIKYKFYPKITNNPAIMNKYTLLCMIQQVKKSMYLHLARISTTDILFEQKKKSLMASATGLLSFSYLFKPAFFLKAGNRLNPVADAKLIQNNGNIITNRPCCNE